MPSMPDQGALSRITLALLLVGIAVLAASASGAAPAGKPAIHRAMSTGERIARQLCAACHVVASDQEFGPLLEKPAPSFREIANRPESSSGTLVRFITTTHWDVDSIPMKMPNPSLTPDQTVEVARYIMSQREPAKGIP
ncbi:MAG TPA: cytochrome c [Steroidobacteraceae bacterium]|nr:cytochrome c [Steroidobacteraceae bacterium]